MGRRDVLKGALHPLAPQLATLSLLLPRSQWQSLVHLDAVKARNKRVFVCGEEFGERQWQSLVHLNAIKASNK